MTRLTPFSKVEAGATSRTALSSTEKNASPLMFLTKRHAQNNLHTRRMKHSNPMESRE